MPLEKAQQAAGDRVLEALEKAPPSIVNAVMNAHASGQAMRAVDAEIDSLYADAMRCKPTCVADLKDPVKYAAVGVLLMMHARSTRQKDKMFMHLAKVFGHDSKNINIDDRRSFKDIITELQEEFRGAKPIEVVVKDAHR